MSRRPLETYTADELLFHRRRLLECAAAAMNLAAEATKEAAEISYFLDEVLNLTD